MITTEQIDRIIRFRGDGLPVVSAYIAVSADPRDCAAVRSCVRSLVHTVRAEDDSLEREARLSLREDIELERACGQGRSARPTHCSSKRVPRPPVSYAIAMAGWPARATPVPCAGNATRLAPDVIDELVEAVIDEDGSIKHISWCRPARATGHELAEQKKNWTSVIGWVPFNEGWGEWSREATGRIAEDVRRQGPTRLVKAARRSAAPACSVEAGARVVPTTRRRPSTVAAGSPDTSTHDNKINLLTTVRPRSVLLKVVGQQRAKIVAGATESSAPPAEISRSGRWPCSEEAP